MSLKSDIESPELFFELNIIVLFSFPWINSQYKIQSVELVTHDMVALGRLQTVREGIGAALKMSSGSKGIVPGNGDGAGATGSSGLHVIMPVDCVAWSQFKYAKEI